MAPIQVSEARIGSRHPDNTRTYRGAQGIHFIASVSKPISPFSSHSMLNASDANGCSVSGVTVAMTERDIAKNKLGGGFGFGEVCI